MYPENFKELPPGVALDSVQVWNLCIKFKDMLQEGMVIDNACVRGSPMVPLVGNICTNLIVNGTIGKEIGTNGKNGNTIDTNGTNVTNQWYHCENPEHAIEGPKWL